MDLVRGTMRILLPICVVAAIVLIAGGAIQNFHNYDQVVNTLAGGQQTIPGGPVASQEAIKDLGTNGGGFYNVNSAHPFENPTTWTNWVEIFLLLVISFSLPRTFGRMVGSKKQGFAIAAVMATLAFISWGATMWIQLQAHGTVPTAVGSAMEGVEQRFGVANSAVFAASTTLTSTGVGRLVPRLLHQPRRHGHAVQHAARRGRARRLRVPACTACSILAVITVFVAGLMVGRTPEYLGKKITPREIKLAATYFLITPLLVLTGTAVAMAMPGQRAGMLNSGPHGLSEVLYAFTSAANNNGSAFAGITVNTDWYNTALGLAMVFGRFLPIIFVLALAGSLATAGQDAGIHRHAAHPPTAVRRHGRRRDADPGRPDLPAHARARAAR